MSRRKKLKGDVDREEDTSETDEEEDEGGHTDKEDVSKRGTSDEDTSDEERMELEEGEGSSGGKDVGKIHSPGFRISDCVEVGRNWKNKLEVECKLCGLRMLKASFWRHREHHSLGLRCQKCSFRTNSEEKLQEHYKKHDGVIYSCSMLDCGKEFIYRSDFLRHYQSVHNKLPDQLVCNFCNKAFVDKTSLDIHKLSHDKGNYECTECEKSFKTLSSLKIHQMKHNGEYPFECSTCDLKFARNDKYNRHLKTHDLIKSNTQSSLNLRCPHVEPEYKNPVDLQRCSDCGLICNSCGIIFRTRKLSRHHTHNNLCQTCGWKSSHKKAHQSHVRFHFVAPEFRCETCKFGFIALKHFDMHNYREHNIPIPNRKLEVQENNANIIWECKVCNKTYATQVCLSVHLKQHDEKKYKCHLSSCDKEFTTSTQLNLHISKHVKDTPHSCSECGKQFVRKTDLNRHEKTHDPNPSMIDCQLCDMKLKSNRNLQLHLQYHKNRAEAKKDFKCNIKSNCGKMFLRKSHLKIHQRDHHGELVEAKVPAVRLPRRNAALTGLAARLRVESDSCEDEEIISKPSRIVRG